MSKKIISVLITIAIVIGAVAGCGNASKTNANEDNKISIVTTTFAPYDFTRQITGDHAELTMLLKPGAESHSYEPTTQDIRKIQECDVFVYVGGESDAWVTDVLNSIGSGSTRVIKLIDCVDVVEEELKEGMEPEEEEAAGEGEEEPEYDEHVWTSPKNAIKIVEKISEALCSADAANKADYEAGAAAYIQKLTALDSEFSDVVANAQRRTVVFGDRFPLRYFVDAYGLDYFAAFPGCSDDTEASAATVAFLIDKVKTEGIPVVFHIELSNEKIADTICEATGAKKRLFHACHNVSKADFDNGATYLSLMEQNVNALREALS
jgi:zinc transport system substrate-binding protein